MIQAAVGGYVDEPIQDPELDPVEVFDSLPFFVVYLVLNVALLLLSTLSGGLGLLGLVLFGPHIVYALRRPQAGEGSRTRGIGDSPTKRRVLTR